MRKVRTIIKVMLVFGLILFIEKIQQDYVDKIGLENLNLQLIGVVERVDKDGNFHNYGIIDVRILKSNIENYDPPP